MSKRILLLAILMGMQFYSSSDIIAQDGADLFKQNCSACHKLGERLVGPDLTGISNKRSEEWLLKFIKSSQSLIKSGDADAVAIYEEYNKIMMTDQNLSDDQIRSILSYISTESQNSQSTASTDNTTSPETPATPIEYSEEDIAAGQLLFSGKKSLINRGPSCISCHNINNDALINGGKLAKDLTNVYSRMGDAGLTGILGAPPFPAMATSYGNNSLDSTEIVQLVAFLKNADAVSQQQNISSGASIFILGGGGGLIVLLLLISFHWNRRLKNSVKHDIYKRQIKSI